MKFGIQTSLNGVSWQQLDEAWRFLDSQTGYDSVWVPDHFVPTMGDATAGSFEAFTSLAALASVTSRVRIGSLVAGVTYRNPALVGKMAVTIDHISGGRFIMGIGAAWHEPEHRFFGWEFPPVGEREDQLEEAAELLTMMLDGETVADFHGGSFRLEQAPIAPGAVHGKIPLLIGGGGERRTLRTAARFADWMNLSMPTPADARRKIEVLEQHCRDVGRDSSAIIRSIQTPVFVTDDDERANRVAATFGAGRGLSVEEAKKQLPVGRPAEVREVLKKFADAGVEYAIQQSQGPWRQDVYARISDEVIARLV